MFLERFCQIKNSQVRSEINVFREILPDESSQFWSEIHAFQEILPEWLSATNEIIFSEYIVKKYTWSEIFFR